jgi:signal transduction histidine kinase
VKPTKDRLSKENKVTSFILPIFLSLCILAVVIFIGVFQLSESERRIHDETLANLDLNSQIVSQQINDLYVSLEVAAPGLAFEAGFTQDQMLQSMNALRDACGFDYVVRTNTDGIAFNYQGKENIDLSGREYIHQALAGQRAFAYVDAGTYDPSSAYVILAVPITYGGSVVGVLHGSYKVSNFDNMLSGFVANSSSHSSATFIVTSGGKLIAASDRSVDSGAFTRVLLRDSQVNSANADALAADLAVGQSGYFSLSAEGKKQYDYYTPLSDEAWGQWVMVTVVDQSAIDAQTQSLKIGIIVLFTVSICITAALIYSVLRRQRFLVQQREDAEALAQALDDAEKANRSKSDFLSRISHDMRTPLNGIIGMTYLAKKNDNSPDTANCLEKIDTSSQFLLGLINDVLDMAKVESGEMELHPEPYDMHQFLDYVDSVIKPLCVERGITLVFDLEPVRTRRPVMDPLRFNQVCFNLLSNAVKFTPEGGTVTLRIHNKMVSDTRLAMDLGIIDTGVGMSEAFQRTMFDPFTQENRDDNSATRGSGLGLAITKKIIDLMGGTIAVHSAPGAGTAFHIQLEFDSVPITADDGAAPKEPAAQAVDLAGKHILLCEDHPLNQEIALSLLQAKGMIVVTAENGLAGKAAFSRSVPGYFDAILMDIRMPVMDGYAATREIRALARPDAGTVPIIAMTADAFADDVQRCIDAGMNGHIAKPIDPDNLMRSLAAAIAAAEKTALE